MSTIEIYNAFKNSTGVSIDTRTLVEGNLFFALKGPSFNGNLYAETALIKGAHYAIVDQEIELENTEYTSKLIHVNNVLSCLQKLSTYHRRQLSIPIIAITGTNGKTTTKELLASILSRQYNIQFTAGNLNNHIGVPLTLLSITEYHDHAIVEMGANHLNDIKELCEIAEPDYGYITNIGAGHLEGFGSIEGVFSAKSQLFKWIEKFGLKCFVNQFDSRLLTLALPKSKIIYLNSKIQLAAAPKNLKVSIDYDNETIQTQLTGDYNFENINAAITISEFFKVSQENIIEGIESYTPSNNRSQVISHQGATILMDAYNANPSSMTKSIDNIVNIDSEKKMVILGEMLELGIYKEEKHDSILNKVITSDIQKVVIIGDAFVQSLNKYENQKKVTSFANTAACKEWFSKQEIKDYIILIKGSRGNKLESLLTPVTKKDL